MDDLYKQGEKYRKNRDWSKAIDCFEKIIEANPLLHNGDVHVSLARCFRRAGKLEKAEHILQEGKKLFPKKEQIFIEFHKVYDALGDWKSAEKVCQQLIALNHTNANHHFRLGRTYSWLNDYDAAAEAYKKGLEYRHKMSIDDLIQTIQKDISADYENINSKYICIKGRNNLGAFVHEYNDKKYFTKICRFTRGAKRELTFYKNICEDFPQLQKVAPKYISSKIKNKILYLTIEYVEGKTAKSKDIKNIIELTSIISSVKYKEIYKRYPNPTYSFQLKNNRPVSATLIFTEMDKEEQNQMFFDSLKEIITRNNYPEDLKTIIEKLEQLIIGNKLFYFLDREKHFSLLHADLFSRNTKVAKERTYIFDWATYTIGPFFIDIARFLCNNFYPYEKIKELNLFQNLNKYEQVIIEIFFLYTLISFYILRNPKRYSIEKRLKYFIRPAFIDLSKLVNEFNHNMKHIMIENRLNDLMIEREEEELRYHKVVSENKKIISENKKVKQEYNKIKKQFNDLLQSRSWKVTAPLRKLMEKIKR